VDPVLQELHDSTFNKPSRRPVPTWAPQIPLEGAGVNFSPLDKKRTTQKGRFCVTLASEILIYLSKLRFPHLRKP